MKLKSKLLLTIVCMAVGYSLIAQSQNKDAKADDKGQAARNRPRAKPVSVYLGKSDKSGGVVPHRLFDELLAQGLTAKDSAGKIYKVSSFIINYGERNLYEDSVGNPLIVTDYFSEPCYGDTLTSTLLNNIVERSKPGDTVYFDMIYAQALEGYKVHGKSMKFVLTK